MIPLPLMPVVAAGLIPFIVGAVWYHPGVFGTRWMKHKHITPEMAEQSARRSMYSTVLVIVLGMIMSLMLSRVLFALSIDTYSGGIAIAAFLWLGFVVPVTINRILWDHVPFSLYAIESGKWLVTLCIMSLVLI